MQDVLILPRTQLPAGTRNLGPTSIPLGVVQAGLEIDKTFWTNPAVKLSAQFDVSYDGGSNWQALGGFADEPGGSGDVSFAFLLAQPTNNQRRARATLTVVGGVCDITVSVRLFDGTEDGTP